MKKSSNKGFTLVELIIVIAILAIIMLIAIPNFSGIQQRMQVRADKATAAQIGKAVRVWFTDYTTDKSLDTTGGKKLPENLPVVGAAAAPSTGKVVTPMVYSELINIDSYISGEQKPNSLKVSGSSANDPDQKYGVFLTDTYTSADAKISVAVISSKTSGGTTTTSELSFTDKPEVDYNGSEAGVAYIEP